MGVKTLHFKTSPQKEEYEIGTFITPFVSVCALALLSRYVLKKEV